MAEMKFDAQFGDTDLDPRPFGSMVVGTLLVAVGAALLAERTNLLPGSWRLLIWPVLLMAVGIARLALPARRGRRGLFFVLAGAWWFAGLQGWLSFERTWPVLIVFYGASVMLQGVTAQPGLERSGRRQHSSGLSWVLTAILVGAFITSGGPHGWSRIAESREQGRLVALMGRSEHLIRTSAFTGAETLSVMGRNVVDLRELPDGGPSEMVVDGFTAMGNTTIRVPRGWNVDMQAVAVMGRTRDRRNADRDDTDWSAAPQAAPSGSPHRLIVRGMVLMGELAVTN